MADTTNLDDKEKINFLFKNYLGFPNTDEGKPFFLETTVSPNNYVIGSEILLDKIPTDPSFNTLIANGSINIDNGFLTKASISDDSTGTIRRFEKVKLEKISGTSRGYYLRDQSGINILANALQFNTNKKSDGTQPYLYKLFSTSGVDNDSQILPNSAGGNWLFDVKNGVINFSDEPTGHTVNESNPPYLTFYKYIGRKGIDLFEISDVSGVTDLRNKLNDLSGNFNDLSGNFNDLSGVVLDLSTNFWDLSGTVSDLSQNFWDLSGNLDREIERLIDLSKNVADISDNIYRKDVLDASFSAIDASLNDISNNTYRKDVLDASFSAIDASLNDIYAEVGGARNAFSSRIDSNETAITDLSGNFNDLSGTVYDLSANFWDLSGNLDYLSANTYRKLDEIKLLNNGSNGEIQLYSSNNQTVGIHSNNDSFFNGGNVGIGNNNPSEKLDVTGNIHSTGTITNGDGISISILDASLNDISNNTYRKDVLDASFSAIDASLNALDASLNALKTDVDGIPRGIKVIGRDPNSNDISFNEVTNIKFNASDGFNIDLSNGVVNIGIENTGGTLSNINFDLSANGGTLLDGSNTVISDNSGNINIVAGSNISIKGSNTASPPSITISAASEYVNNSNQTFFDILTQQPNQFTAVSTSSSSSQITINWNYDDIMPKHATNIFAKLMFPSALADRSLPNIDEIRFDLSGVNTLNSDASGVWIYDSGSTITINSSEDYNSGSTYKSKIFPKTPLSDSNDNNIKNILSKTSPIDIRVYGVTNNNDINYPTVDNRALIFTGLQFAEAAPPSKPNRQSVELISSDEASFSVIYKVVQTENGVNNSDARINEITGKYTELSGNDTLVSAIITQNTNEQTKTTSLNLLNAGDDLPITFDNLRFGTKYTYKVSVKNNFSSASSVDSNISTMSNFTRIPQARSKDLNLNIHNDSLKSILKPGSLVLSDIIYVNISETTGLKFAETNVQTFEVTDTSATTSSTNGIGKGVDNENDIVEIEISKNVNGGAYTSLQLIKYSGFDTSAKRVKDIISQSANNIITDVSTNDMYLNDVSKNGFRIEGKFKLNNIAYNNITSLIGAASSNPYGLKLNYARTYGTGSNITKAVYIDDFDTDPSITKTSETFDITDVLYTMGIPSVKTFTATFNRTYENICSQYGFIPGDRIIGEITSIAGTNKSSSETSVTITNIEIPTSSPFNKTKSTTISNIFYTEKLLSHDATLNVQEKAFSLKKPSGNPSDGGSDTITTRHFCDRESYNLSSNQINTRKFQTPFYEIADNQIGNLSSNLGTIGVTEYSDSTHKTQIKPWTLLFIDGKLQTNEASPYPDFSNFNQNGIVSNDQSTYSSGSSSYNLSGVSTGNDNNGYKWIVFKIPSNSSTYVKEASSKTSEPPLPYIDVPSFIDDLPFNSNSNIKTKINTGFGEQNVIGFIRIINSDNDICIGRFTSNKDANNLWYGGGNSSSVSLSAILADDGTGQIYGSLIDTGNHNVANVWGVQCPTQSNFQSGSDIEIFIGMKNSVSL